MTQVYIDQSLCSTPTMHPVERRLRDHLEILELVTTGGATWLVFELPLAAKV